MDNTIGALPRVRFGEWISEGWNMFASAWKVWVLNALVLSLVTVVPIVGIYLVVILLAASSTGSGGAGIGVVMVMLIFLAVLLVTLGSAYLVGGMYRTAFKQLRGEPISVNDLFSGGDCFPSMLGAMLLYGLLVSIAVLLCVVPVFIVAGALSFTFPLIVERRLGVIEAMQASREATRGDLLMFVLFAFVLGLIAQAGAYACGIGILITLPLKYTVEAVAYRDCFGLPGARSFASSATQSQGYGAPPLPPAYQPAPPQQWQSYDPPPSPSWPESPAAPPYASHPEYQAPPVQTPPSVAPPQQPPETSARQPAGQINCPSCQMVLPATARFCARCGRSLTEQ